MLVFLMGSWVESEVFKRQIKILVDSSHPMLSLERKLSPDLSEF